MSKRSPDAIWSNSPDWFICCTECGCQFNPKSMHHKRCANCISSPDVTDEESAGIPQVEAVQATLKNIVGDTAGCQCEPCPVDIRGFGYQTCKEDPYFEGTKCLWHEQIRGVKGTIVVNGGTEKEPTFCAVLNNDQQVIFGRKEFTKFAKRIGAKKR